MKTRHYFLVLSALISLSLTAQPSFTNRNDLLAEKDLHSAVPVGVADMNGDGLDDIVALHRGRTLYIQYQTPDPARPFVRYDLPTSIANNEQNDIVIADLNNDGANDIYITGTFELVKTVYNIPYTYDFELVTQMVEPFFSQGASAGDFNGDGWVDIVVLNDNGLNYTMINDGAGTLEHFPDSIFNFFTVPASDNSGNYGSVYTDFDMDGDNDFYIAKCRQGVTNPNDPRRINVLHENIGNNNYVENAAAYGLASGRQSWTADFGDMDNDGDLDVFITQHDVISELFENIENDTFINITASAGLNIGGIPLQGMFRDFDNDGFQDLLVTGDRVDYYHNNGDKTFTAMPLFGTTVFGAYALGDLNNDGFTDIYASRVIPFNQPDLANEDILYLNEGNENHFLALRLKDPTGNPSAIGATAMLFGKWGTQIRMVRGGEQYGVSNSHAMIFGLGEETTYDSLVIRWPDGETETYKDLATDQNWLIQRGGCATTSEKRWADLDVLCDADSILLSLTDIDGDFTWSTGSTADSILIKESGLYFATYLNDDECPVIISPIEVTQDPDTIKPTISYDGNLVLCNKEIAQLSLPSAQGYQWSTGETTQIIEVTESGAYFAAVQGYCKFQFSDTINLEFIVPEPPVVEPDTFKEGESAILVAHGDSIVWYDDSLGTNIIGTGSILVLDNLTESTTVYAENLNSMPGADYQLGPAEQEGEPKYNGDFVNGGLLFEVNEPIILKEFTVFTDFAGTRIIEISGPGFFAEQQVDIDSGVTVIQLNLEIPPGAYTVTTNTDLNNLVFGENSPFLWRSSENVQYPYEVNNVISITSSTFGAGYYYYFYDWKVMTKDKYCGSDLVPVTAVSEEEVATVDPSSDVLFISPNPTNGITTITFKTSASGSYDLISPAGKIIRSGVVSGNKKQMTIDFADLTAGMYLIRFKQDNQIFTRKIIRL